MMSIKPATLRRASSSKASPSKPAPLSSRDPRVSATRVYPMTKLMRLILRMLRTKADAATSSHQAFQPSSKGAGSTKRASRASTMTTTSTTTDKNGSLSAPSSPTSSPRRPKRKAPLSWDILEHREVAATPFRLGAHKAVTIEKASKTIVSGTYMFDASSEDFSLKNAVVRSRAALLDVISKREDSNYMIEEGWSYTSMSKADAKRVEIRYSARPALASGAGVTDICAPPFLAVLGSP